MKYVWHYTVAERFEGIVETGAIVTEDERPVPPIEGMPGAVWFSTVEDYEPTAIKPFSDSENGEFFYFPLDEYHRRYGPLIRLGVPADRSDLVNWTGFRKKCTCRSKIIRNMEASALKQGGNVRNYWACFERVPLNQCITEVWDGDKWIRAVDVDHAQELISQHPPSEEQDGDFFVFGS